MFKLKVCDTLNRAYKALITFYNMSEDGYESLNSGVRVSIAGASLGRSRVNQDMLQLNFRKGTQIKQIAKSFADE